MGTLIERNRGHEEVMGTWKDSWWWILQKNGNGCSVYLIPKERRTQGDI